jgi:POT family proton-dependent oligopeptide transporter
MSVIGIQDALPKKQPNALYVISASNLWERFCYYTTRGILTLYMVKVLLFTHHKAYAVFAAFNALLYLAPLCGGYLGDSFLSSQRGVLFGGFLLSIGYFFLATPGIQCFYIGLATVIIGNGFFMPNISSVLGRIYYENDPRQEGGFSILYSAINIGAFIPPLISASIISFFGWHAAFFVAGLGALLGVLIFYVFVYQYSLPAKITIGNYVVFIAGLVLAIILTQALVTNTHIANMTLFSVGGLLVIYVIKGSFRFVTQVRYKLWVCLLLTAYSVLFCVLYEQAAMSLTMYTEYNVDRNWHHWLIPTTMFLAFNPLFIVICGPLISKLWIWLDMKNLNPSIPAKFGLGTILIGMGFIILPLGISMQSSVGQINLGWVVLSYFLQSIGELLVYPVGLSMMTALSPKKMVGLMVGIWYFATAIGNSLAGFASTLTVLSSGKIAPLNTSATYSFVFGTLGWSATVAGLILLVFVKPIVKLLK